jgi:DNA polymerase alpha-associated DNA helicase A
MALRIRSFCELQLSLLETERAAEVAEVEAVISKFPAKVLQKKYGLALVGLKLTSIRTGLGGKTVVELGNDDVLPSHRFRTGDVVGLDNASADNSAKCAGGKSKGDKVEEGSRFDVTGVVARVTEKTITLALGQDQPEDVFDKPVRLFKLANNISFERMEKAIVDLRYIDEREGLSLDQGSRSLVKVLFGIEKPSFTKVAVKDLKWFDPSLNESQKRAVALALGAESIALIHGPPGTGKTYTVVELIKQLASPKEKGGRGERVLVCGPSNISVDNLVERLGSARLNIVRVGSVVRVLPTVLSHSLDVRINSSDEGSLVKDVRADIDKALKTAATSKSRVDRREAYKSLKDLRKELKVREANAIDAILKKAPVVLSTLSGAASRHLKNMEFDTIVIDEAAQALEAECWIAMLKGKRVILAGDHLQLPPTVKSSKVSAGPKLKSSDPICKMILDGGGLEFTLFDRLMIMYGDSVRVLLNVQYRMSSKIQDFSSKELYGGELVAHESVRQHLLSDLEKVEKTDDTSEALVFWDTAGSEMRESLEKASAEDAKADWEANSKFNENEVELCVQHVRKLVEEAKVPPSAIGIISPYNGQVTRLRAALKDVYPDLEIASVDSYQGREKEAVILSLVRSNEEGEVGFLSESRRLNVAITRARRHLFICGDSETLGRNPFLRRLCEYAENEGDLRM